MIRELIQKDIESCIQILGEKVLYNNLRTRMLAFLQTQNCYAYGYFQSGELLGFIFFSSNSFDLTIHFLGASNLDEAVIKNLVNVAKKKAKTLGAAAIYINYHHLDKSLLNILEILEQYRLE